MEWEKRLNKFDTICSDRKGKNNFLKTLISLENKTWLNEMKKWLLHNPLITEEIIIEIKTLLQLKNFKKTYKKQKPHLYQDLQNEDKQFLRGKFKDQNAKTKRQNS